MQRKGLVIVAIIGAVIVLMFSTFLGACAKPAPTGPIELIFTNYTTETEASSVTFKYFAEQVTERTGGQVTFRTYYAGALGAAKEVLPFTREGTTDLCVFWPAYYPGLFPLQSIADLAYTGLRTDGRQRAFLQLLKEFPEIEAEFTAQNVKLLTPCISESPPMATKDKRIETVEDIQGLKFRTGGIAAVMVEKWGGVPVSLPSGESYEAMSRGVTDGAFSSPFGAMISRGMHEVANYWTDPETGPTSALILVMNLDSYNGLPSDIREIFDEAAMAAAEELPKIRMDATRQSLDKAVPAGIEMYPLSEEVKAQLAALAEDAVYEKWVGGVVDTGVSEAEAREILARVIELYKQYEPELTYLTFMELYEREYK